MTLVGRHGSCAHEPITVMREMYSDWPAWVMCSSWKQAVRSIPARTSDREGAGQMNILRTASIPTLLPHGFGLKVMHLPSLYPGSQGLRGDLCASQSGWIGLLMVCGLWLPSSYLPGTITTRAQPVLAVSQGCCRTLHVFVFTIPLILSTSLGGSSYY